MDLIAQKLIFCLLFAALLNNSNTVNIFSFNFYYIQLLFSFLFKFVPMDYDTIHLSLFNLSFGTTLGVFALFFRHNIIQYNYTRVITSVFIQKQNLPSCLKEQSKMANGLK